MALEELSECSIRRLLDRAYRLVAMVRAGRLGIEALDELWEVIVELDYELSSGQRAVGALMN